MTIVPGSGWERIVTDLVAARFLCPVQMTVGGFYQRFTGHRLAAIPPGKPQRNGDL